MSAVDRVTALLRQVGTDQNKTAGSKLAMDDPGYVGGKSKHESALPEAKANEQAASEGEQTAANSAALKEQTRDSVDSLKPVTVGSAPKDTDQQPGNATPTGEDPGSERDFKGTKDDSETSHPANGSVGGKYAYVTREYLASLPDADLNKLASDLGNEVLADVANGKMTPSAPQPKTASITGGKSTGQGVTPEQAAAAGYSAAEKIASAERAAEQLLGIRKLAMEDADRVARIIIYRRNKLAEEVSDPTGKAAEGEQHGSEGMPPEEGGEGGGGEAAMAMMGGGGGEAEAGGMPPMGADAGMGPTGQPEGPPPEMGGMHEGDILQQLLMALQEAGIDLSQLAQAPAPGPGLAEKAAAFRRRGNFEIREVKTASERNVRRYLKRFVTELVSRSA